jgi:L-arabinose transport system ATP-binding protein
MLGRRRATEAQASAVVNERQADELSEPGGPLIEFRSVSKSFGDTQALHEVSFSIARGELLALVGENGAGKSTLLKILSGDQRPDEGSVVVDGEQVDAASPLDARRMGVRVVYQEPELIPTLSVAENLFLDQRRRIVRWSALQRDARSLLQRLGFDDDVDPGAAVEDLAPAQRQLVEIAKAVHSNARVVAFDEPTSALGAREVQRLFSIIEKLRAEGTAVIYVSHRLEEVLALADSIVVLRDGEVVAARPAVDIDERELVRLMVGRPILKVFERPQHRGTVDADISRLQVEGLTTHWLRDVSLDLMRGEVLGVAGLVGSGRSELAKALFGSVAIVSGRVRVDGKPVSLGSPASALAAGICYTPEDRKRDGLVEMRSVRENLTLAALSDVSSGRVMRRKREQALAQGLVRDLAIKLPSLDHPVSALSGGNQQKVVLGRMLARRPRVLILDDPTRGIDVGAKAEIYRLIFRLADDGVSVIFMSSETAELIGVCDRIIVMREGRVAGEVARAEATEEVILSLALPEHSSAASASVG